MYYLICVYLLPSFSLNSLFCALTFAFYFHRSPLVKESGMVSLSHTKKEETPLISRSSSEEPLCSNSSKQALPSSSPKAVPSSSAVISSSASSPPGKISAHKDSVVKKCGDKLNLYSSSVIDRLNLAPVAAAARSHASARSHQVKLVAASKLAQNVKRLLRFSLCCFPEAAIEQFLGCLLAATGALSSYHRIPSYKETFAELSRLSNQVDAVSADCQQATPSATAYTTALNFQQKEIRLLPVPLGAQHDATGSGNAFMASMASDHVLLAVDVSSISALQDESTGLAASLSEQLCIMRLMGKEQVILCIFNMETADWSRRRYDVAIAAVVSGCVRKAGFSAKQVISCPVSVSLNGQGEEDAANPLCCGINLLQRPHTEKGTSIDKFFSSYDGPSLLPLLSSVPAG